MEIRVDPFRDTSIQEYELMGVRVSAMTIGQWVDVIDNAVRTGQQRIMVGQNLHSTYLAAHSVELRQLQRIADHVRIDGLPIIVFGRLLGYPLRLEHRSGFMDLLEPLLTRARSQRWRIHYLGSREDVAMQASQVLQARYPGLILSTTPGFFDMSNRCENEKVLDEIRRSNPHVLIVGMGMPRQERWILDNRERLDASAIVACGAAMEYVAGSMSMAPRWLSRIGGEWMFRLASDPKRLWKRYLIEPWFVLGLFLRDLRERLR